MAKARTYSRTVRHACELLGAEIRQGRIERRWPIRELAERAGVTPRTVVRVEHGDPTVGIGICFDLAVLCGVALFGTDRAGIARELSESRHRLTLLPASARPRRPADDDAF
jgi:transcriptional regulator with XRE-family HTH domain